MAVNVILWRLLASSVSSYIPTPPSTPVEIRLNDFDPNQTDIINVDKLPIGIPIFGEGGPSNHQQSMNVFQTWNISLKNYKNLSK